MKPISWRLLAVLLALTASGCESRGVGLKQGVGTLAGGAAGGLVGNQFGQGSGRVAATAAGAVLGALLGGEIGRQLDEADQRAVADAHYQALETAGPNRPVQWRNERSGHYGQVTAGPGYYVNERNCRDYAHTVHIDGEPEILRGTACRDPDGSWRNVS